MNAKALINIKDLSLVTGLSVASLRYHIRKGRIQPLRFGRRVLFNLESIVDENFKLGRENSNSLATCSDETVSPPSTLLFENKKDRRPAFRKGKGKGS